MLVAADPATLIAVVAMLLLAWNASRQERNALVALGGLLLMIVAFAVRFAGNDSLFARVAGFFTDAGVAFILASLVMRLRRAHAFPFFALGILALGTATLLFTGGHVIRAGLEAARPEETAPPSLLVELGPDDHIEEIAPVLRLKNIRYERAFPSVTLSSDEDLAQTYLLYGPEPALESIVDVLRADRDNVDHLEWNRTVTLPPTVLSEAPEAERLPLLADDPLAASQWALQATHIHEAHRLLAQLRPRKKAVVAILDTGVDAAHEDLLGIFHPSPGQTDTQGHGTHCAGIAGAATNNSLGIASLNWEGRYIEIASFQALPGGGFGTYETIAQAIIDATQSGADILSLSLGNHVDSPPRVVQQAVEFAQRQGALIIASAGNAGQDGARHMPSNLPGVIAVAAVDRDLHKASFSNTNTNLSRPIAAPGVDILSLKPGGSYVNLSGTSMSTPLVAGLAGVLLALNPDLSADQIYQILVETGTQARDVTLTGRVINAEAAIKAVAEGI